MLGWFKKRRKKEEQEQGPVREEQREGSSDGAAPSHGDTGQVAEEPAVSAPARSEGDDIQSGEIPVPTEQSRTTPEPANSVKTPVREPERKNEGTSLFSRLQKRLSKIRKSLVYRLDSLFLGKKEIDQDLFDELEEILITADLGVATTHELLDDVKKEVRRQELKDPRALKAVLKEQILAYLLESDKPGELVMPESGPFVIMVVGVNGVGKTTSIGKIAAKFARSGSSVLLVAADTFRAAAIDQLKIWAERCGADIVAQKQGADPSAVVYDAIEYGRHRNVDVIIVDTAGRLHTQVNLMEELKKIKRVIGKKLAGAPHEVMLIIDATTGQNGISQAKLFNEAVEITGLTLTKLDGTAKGGIIVNICRELGIPVRFIGIGEKIDDLRDFDPREFVDALFAGSPADSAPD
ncbi:MAG TPA: signal recognition particle-docking protein FtsY [Desulfobacteraceae bacterium]|nr:signal recognition particle-docking protein FtsY [Desulfobacteraceae bacterium]